MAGYGTDEGFQTWADDNGYTIPPDTNVAAARSRGSAYIDGVYGARFSGEPVGGSDQERVWPRTGAADIWGHKIPDDVVPQRVINASYHAALAEAESPGSLGPTVISAQIVKREKVGPIEMEYQASADGDAVADNTPVIASIEFLLFPLLSSAQTDALPAILVV